MEQTKWPDRPHWSYAMTVLGTDDKGIWAAVHPGTPARRANGPIRRLSGFVVLVPPTDAWIVECYPDHSAVAIYVNIGTIPEIRGGAVTQVDLDLDVVRRRDGTVSIDDRDEFTANCERYPQALVELAENAAARAESILRPSPDPFGAHPWLEMLPAIDPR